MHPDASSSVVQILCEFVRRFVSTAALSRLVRDRTYLWQRRGVYQCTGLGIPSGQRRDVYGFSHRGFRGTLYIAYGSYIGMSALA